jgi:hypothetical protein
MGAVDDPLRGELAWDAESGLLQGAEKLGAEDAGEGVGVEEVLALFLLSLSALAVDSAARHYDMDMGMVIQSAVVGMQDGRHAELGAEVCGVGAERLEGFAHAVEEGLVDHALVMPGPGRQLVGEGEGHEKVLHREELGLLALQPLGRVVVLALGTAAMSTRQRPPLVGPHCEQCT